MAFKELEDKIDLILPQISTEKSDRLLNVKFYTNQDMILFEIDNLKAKLKDAKNKFFDDKQIISEMMALYTNREKEYQNLIDKLTDKYNNDVAVVEGLPIYGRKAINTVEIEIKNILNIPDELSEYITLRNEDIVREWYELKYKQDGFLPLIKGIDAKIVKTYKGVK